MSNTPQSAPLPVIMEDPIIHSEHYPFCTDPLCPCHQDIELFQGHIETPRRAGLLTAFEAIRIFYVSQKKI